MAIYLDHNATSPMHPEVTDAMMPFLRNPTGNPSSLHSFGRMARSAVESARTEVADLLGCSSDAVIFTSGGKIPIDMARLDIDAISFSAHKLRGPQGVGALVVNRKPRNVLISGGYQENRLRGGTENVAGIVGLGKAAQVARLEMAHKKHHLEQLRDVFEARLATIPGSVVFGQHAPRLPNTTYFALPYYHGETLLMELDRAGFALSCGSACHSVVTEPSHVLTAMGVDDSLALNAIRVSFGMDNSLQDVEQLAVKLHELVDRLPAVVRQAAV